MQDSCSDTLFDENAAIQELESPAAT